MTSVNSLSLLLHLLALAMWIGGMVFFLIVLGPAAHRLESASAPRLLNQARSRFEALSWAALALLSVTGVFSLVVRSEATAGQLGQHYLTLLAIKLLVFLAMLVHHGLQVFKHGPRIGALTAQLGNAGDAWPEPLRSHWEKWFRLLKINAALGPVATLLGLALVQR